MIRDFFSWIVKSFQYAWFLRHDRDWDYAHILILLRYKLLRTAKCIGSDKTSGSSARVYNDIVNLLIVLDRIIEDDYFTPELSELLEKDDRLDINPHKTPLTKAEERRLRVLLRRYEKTKEDDFKTFFDELKGKIRSFWC